MQPQSPESLTPQDQLIADKYKICWGMAVDRYAGNVHAMSGMLYQSLYNPSYYTENAAEFASKKFPDRLETLSSEIVQPYEVPTEQEFTDALAHEIRYGLDYGSCNYPEAVDQVEKLTGKGQVIIWTAGDTTGVGEHSGSMIQHSKAAAAGLNSLRTQISAETGRKRTEILSVMASEDKISDEAIDRMAEVAGDRTPVVADDRLKNLLAIKKRLPDAVLIWVQQDKHGKKIPSALGDVDSLAVAQEFNAISSVGELNGKVDELMSGDPKKESVFFIDYDGVLSDDTMKAQLQEEAVMGVLREKGWN